MARLNAEAINKIAAEIAKRDDFDMVYIPKVKVWFVRNDRGVWEVSDEVAVKERVDNALQAKFQEVLAEQMEMGSANQMSRSAMARVQEALDLYKAGPKKRVVIAMKRYAKDDGDILSVSLNKAEEKEVVEHEADSHGENTYESE